jgi:rhamnogalacturonyl hydrolase YesR
VTNQTVQIQLPHDVWVTSLRDPQPVNSPESSASRPPVAAGGRGAPNSHLLRDPLHTSTEAHTRRRREGENHGATCCVHLARLLRPLPRLSPSSRVPLFPQKAPQIRGPE